MELSSVHPKEFKWTPDHEKRFRTLISSMCKNSLLHLPDPEKTYFVQTDASQMCGGGRIFQKDDNGQELLLACISRTFTKAERSYSTVKKEVLALLYSLKSMDFFLRFANEITILVDARAICYLRLCKDSAGILLRFSLELSKYKCPIVHVPGEQNEISDVLSRHHADIDSLVKDPKEVPPMSEKQALQILNRLKIPTGYEFTKEEVSHMLEATSLPNPEKKKKEKLLPAS